jgi:hypothetical protein
VADEEIGADRHEDIHLRRHREIVERPAERSLGDLSYSDSIATLAGALVGARCGPEAFPPDCVAQVEPSAELLELASRL